MKKRTYLLLLIFALQCSFMSISHAQKTVTKYSNSTAKKMKGERKSDTSSSPSSTEYPKPYLSKEELPDSEFILAPPPDTGSVAFALDVYLATHVFSHVDQARKIQAIDDASMDFAKNQPFKDIIGVTLSKEDTPAQFNLFWRLTVDANDATETAKEKYKRIRPFMYLYCFSCTPQDEEHMRNPDNGSYPSGHTSAGWAYALVLAELYPDKTDEILVRGIDFGTSRNVCGAHWYSDVEAGRTVGAAVVARLQTNDEFRADLAKAKIEVASQRR